MKRVVILVMTLFLLTGCFLFDEGEETTTTTMTTTETIKKFSVNQINVIGDVLYFSGSSNYVSDSKEYNVFLNNSSIGTFSNGVAKLPITDNGTYQVKVVPVDSVAQVIEDKEYTYVRNIPTYVVKNVTPQSITDLENIAFESGFNHYVLNIKRDFFSDISNVGALNIPASVERLTIKMDRGLIFADFQLIAINRLNSLVLELENVCLEGGISDNFVVKSSAPLIVESIGEYNYVTSKYVASIGAKGNDSLVGYAGRGGDGGAGGDVFVTPLFVIKGTAPINVEATDGGAGGKGGYGISTPNYFTKEPLSKPGNGGYGGKGGNTVTADAFICPDAIWKAKSGKGGAGGAKGEEKSENGWDYARNGAKGSDGFLGAVNSDVRYYYCNSYTNTIYALYPTPFMPIEVQFNSAMNKISWKVHSKYIVEEQEIYMDNELYRKFGNLFQQYDDVFVNNGDTYSLLLDDDIVGTHVFTIRVTISHSSGGTVRLFSPFSEPIECNFD